MADRAGGLISARQFDDRFAQLRALAGLPDDLSVRCLRHSYVRVHLIEDGADPLFVQGPSARPCGGRWPM